MKERRFFLLIANVPNNPAQQRKPETEYPEPREIVPWKNVEIWQRRSVPNIESW